MLRILLIGSTGYLGKTLMQHLSQTGIVVPTYRTTARFAASYHYDFWADNIQPLVEQHQIDIVVIAANMAYEATDPACTFATFQQRAEQLIQGCQKCRVVYLSSDGIFDGKKGNYAESDIPTPNASYGRNLHFLEQLVQGLCSDYCIVRPSYLYGYSLSQLDHRLSSARTRLLAGEQRSYFTDMFKSPMDVNQVAQITTFFAHSTYKGIIHVAGEALSVYDFYRLAMTSLYVSTQRLYPVEMPAGFPHPKNTSLDITLMKKLTQIEPDPIHVALADPSNIRLSSPSEKL